MINVRDDIDTESLTRKGERDTFSIFSSVDVKKKEVTITAATLRKGGSTVPEHTLDLAYVFGHVFSKATLEGSALALAIAHPSCCAHCASAEVETPSPDLCGQCLALVGDQGPEFALECALDLRSRLLALRASDPTRAEELDPMIRQAESLVNTEAARARREASAEAAQ